MHEDVDLFRAEAKQPASFDNLEPLVHECSGVDRDLRAHVPGWMTHRFGDSGEFHFRFVLRAKRSAGGGQDNASYFFTPFTSQTLMQSVMFGINRQQLRA